MVSLNLSLVGQMERYYKHSVFNTVMSLIQYLYLIFYSFKLRFLYNKNTYYWILNTKFLYSIIEQYPMCFFVYKSIST